MSQARSEGGSRMSSVLQRWSGVMMNNYGTPPLALASGDGAMVTDVDGKSYVDLLGGIAVNVLGHRHPAVIEAVTRQLNTLGHTSNLYATEPGIALAEALVELLGAEARVFFCNSGTEANEVAFKITRLTGRDETRCRRRRFPRPHDGFARADRPAVEAGAVRAAAGRCRARAVRRHRRAGRRRRRRDSGRVPRADHGGGRRRRPARRLPAWPHARSPPSTGRCWCSTRCRPGWAAPERFSHTSTTGSRRTSSRWPRGWAAGCRSVRASR